MPYNEATTTNHTTFLKEKYCLSAKKIYLGYYLASCCCRDFFTHWGGFTS